MERVSAQPLNSIIGSIIIVSQTRLKKFIIDSSIKKVLRILVYFNIKKQRRFRGKQ